MFQFEYNKMWHHYVQNVGLPTEDIYVKVYNANYVAMKYDKSEKCIPFLHFGMDAWKLQDSDPLLKHDLFKYGAFVVADKKASRRKNLFIVGPAKHYDFFVADHFTFFLNHGVNPLHFHWTTYLPFLGTPIGKNGRSAHALNHMPDSFSLPNNARDFVNNNSHLLTDQLSVYAMPIYDLLSRNFKFPNETRKSYQDQELINGGGKKQRQTKRFVGSNFSKMFQTLPIHRILVFGLKRPNTHNLFDITVYIQDRLHHAPRSTFICFVITLTREEMYDDNRLQIEIAKKLHGKTRLDFMDLKDP